MKYIKVWDQLISANVMQIASEVYNSDRQLSIMQSLSASATAPQNSSLSGLHMVQAKHSKRGPAMEGRSQGTCLVLLLLWSSTFTPKEGLPTRDAECHKCRKKGHFKGSSRSKKEEMEVGRAKDVKRKHKLAKVHKLKA